MHGKTEVALRKESVLCCSSSSHLAIDFPSVLLSFSINFSHVYQTNTNNDGLLKRVKFTINLDWKKPVERTGLTVFHKNMQSMMFHNISTVYTLAKATCKMAQILAKTKCYQILENCNTIMYSLIHVRT